MDGLECKVVSLSEVYSATDYFRIEAEYYNSPSLQGCNLVRGQEIESFIQYGTSKFCDEIEGGYPVLRLNELYNGFIEEPKKYCHLLSTEEFESLRLRKGDVLVVRTNGNPNLVGKAALVAEDTEYAFASYLYRVLPNERINSETLVAFLNSKYGRREIDKNSIKGNQTNFSPAKFRDIKIPILTIELQLKIQKIFSKAFTYRKKAKEIFESAKVLLEQELGYIDYTESREIYSTKSFSEVFGITERMDSEYYQKKYDDYETMLRNYPNGCMNLAEICNVKDSNYVPKDNIEYSYIELANVGEEGHIGECEKMYGRELPTRARRKVSAGDVIISSVEGSLSKCALVTDEFDGFLCTNGFYVLTSDKINSETLMILFKSKYIQALLKRGCSGTILSAISKDELLKIAIPIVETEIQNKIKSCIVKSGDLIKQSDELMKKAIAVVEAAIEQGEDAALMNMNLKRN